MAELPNSAAGALLSPKEEEAHPGPARHWSSIRKVIKHLIKFSWMINTNEL